MSFYYIEIETKGYYMGEIVKQNSKLKPRCCLLRGKCCKYSSDIEAAKAAEEIITKCRIPKDYISIGKVIDLTSSGNNFKFFDNQKNNVIKVIIRLTNGEKIIVDNPSKLLQNKINEIFKGDNMENSNQIEAPVKFGILEEEKVSRKFYPVKNAPADTVLPKRKTAKSAGYDFVLPCDVRLNPRSVSAIIPTNVKAFMPDDEVLMLYIRSSIGIKQHVTLANGTGIIDADYFSNPDNDGNIGICLQNNSDEIVSFKKGERIMQGIFVKYAVCDSDKTNEVRKGGFGSTGKE